MLDARDGDIYMNISARLSADIAEYSDGFFKILDASNQAQQRLRPWFLHQLAIWAPMLIVSARRFTFPFICVLAACSSRDYHWSVLNIYVARDFKRRDART